MRSTGWASFRRACPRVSTRSARFSPSSTASKAAIAASSPIRSTHHISSRSWSSSAHRGRRPRPWPRPRRFTRPSARCRSSIEGFILNRLQAVLLSEAFRLVEDGYVTPQDLDKTLKDGLGLRWSFMGPFETIELNAPGGIPDYCRRYGASLSALSAANPAIYDGEKLAHVLSQWEKVLTPD